MCKRVIKNGMDNSFLLQKLVEKKILDQMTAEKLEAEVSFSRRPIDEIIEERRMASSDEVARVKAELLNIPFKKINLTEVTEEILSVIPEETAINYKVVPLQKNGEMLTVGMVYPDDVRAQDALRFIAKKLQVSLGVYVISVGDFEAVSKKYSPYKNRVEEAVKSLATKYESTKGGRYGMQRLVQLDEGAAVSEEAPIIRIVSSTLQEAVDLKASDIHVEPQRSRVRIRFRIDGELEEATSFPLSLHQPIISRIKILSDLKIDEARIPQDGRFRTIISGRDIDFRVATFPTPMGEKVELRILDSSIGLKGLDELGLVGKNKEILEKGIKKPFGMVLISGPTGSGKTTTLYALMQILNNVGVNIVSLEDPVEYFMEGLNQSQIRPEIGYNFASGLRQILRQDPDIIMVGEIRDEETAELAVHAALTGHIVLSTLHTNNAVSVVPRLLDMGVKKFLLPTAINLMASQRLIGKLCQNCKKEEKVSEEISSEITKALETLPAELTKKIKSPYKIFRAEGCDKCKRKGTLGRVALFEVFEMSKELEGILSAGDFSDIKVGEEAKRQEMITLRQDGVLKALEGLVSMEDVLRETNR